MEIRNYCKSYNFGHRWLKDFFNVPVTVEEKYDGSQLSFVLNERGEVQYKSRNRFFDYYTAHDLFRPTVEYIESIKESLLPKCIYRGEAFKSNKHNLLKYKNIPEGHFVLFDLELLDIDIEQEAIRLDFHPVTVLAENVSITSIQQAEKFLEIESSLGGTLIEGVVFKRRGNPLYNDRDQLIMAKLVSEQFKERKKDFVSEVKNTKTLIERLIETFYSEMLFEKAVQHLSEDNKLLNEPSDIGKLIPEIYRDFWEENRDEVAAKILAEIKKPLERGLVKGFPEWYKRKLAKEQF